MCRTSRIYLSPNRGVKWPFFSSIKLRYQNRAPTPDSDPIGMCMLVQLDTVRIAQSECSDHFAAFGHVN